MEKQLITTVHGVDIFLRDNYYIANFSVKWFYDKDLLTVINELKDYMISHYKTAIEKTIEQHKLQVTMEDVNKLDGSLMLSLFDFKVNAINETYGLLA